MTLAQGTVLRVVVRVTPQVHCEELQPRLLRAEHACGCGAARSRARRRPPPPRGAREVGRPSRMCQSRACDHGSYVKTPYQSGAVGRNFLYRGIGAPNLHPQLMGKIKRDQNFHKKKISHEDSGPTTDWTAGISTSRSARICNKKLSSFDPEQQHLGILYRTFFKTLNSARGAARLSTVGR